jgi:outer membrane protein assembly factor BamB
MKNLLLLLGFAMLFGCSKDVVTDTDKDGVVIGRPHIWAKSITDNKDSLMNTHFVQETALYNDKLLIGVRKNGQRILRLINTDNGEINWDWYDIIEERSYLGVEKPAIIDNRFIWQIDYWNYCIDFNTGKTIWKNAFLEDYGVYPSILGNKFVGMYNYDRNSKRPDSGGTATLFSINDGKPYFSITPRYDTTLMQPFEISRKRGEVRFNKLLLQGSDTLLLLSFVDPPLVNYQYRECLALYNLTQKKWVYDRAEILGIARRNTEHTPCVYNGKVYSAYSGTIVCNDLMTGAKLWQKDIDAGSTGFATTGLVVYENRLYGNSDNGYLYSFNLNNGDEWHIRTSGTSSRLNYLNGVIYFTGSGDGKVHGIEASTGKYLWKLESPDKSINKWAYYTGLCSVIPGKGGQKGKVIVQTGLNIYCYEAER